MKSYEELENTLSLTRWAFFTAVVIYTISIFMLSDKIGELQSSNKKLKAEVKEYTHTVDGMRLNGISEDKIADYIEYGCIPYLEWVR